MQEWIAASDLVLGKAGAATTFEALVMNRPIFHTNYVAYNEKTNVDFCIEKDIGRYIPEPKMLVELLEPLTKDRTPLEHLSQKIADLNLKPGTLDIAKHLIETYLSRSHEFALPFALCPLPFAYPFLCGLGSSKPCLFP